MFGHTQADVLRFSQTNAWLLDLDKEFQNLKERAKLPIVGKELVEDNFIILRSLFRHQVVPPFAGARYFGEPFKVPDSDHFTIAKVDGREAIQHRLLLTFLEDAIRGGSWPQLERICSHEAGRNRLGPAETKFVTFGHFEAKVEVYHAGNMLKYRICLEGRELRFFDIIELWQSDVEFVDFFNNLFKQNGLNGFIWEMPPLSNKTVDQVFEFVTHSLPRSSNRPDPATYADHYDADAVPDGIVSFANLGHDALLIVPSPFRKKANYTGMAEFLREAPVNQQRSLWHEVGRLTRERLSEHPLWLSIAGGGIAWLHVRLDSFPKYYRYQPYLKEMGNHSRRGADRG